jgi:histidyl-tRNA synthetase
MSRDFQPLQGMSDLSGDEVLRWQQLEQYAHRHFARFGFGELRTPLVEKSEVFLRSLGDTTDVVQKEMYAFEDRGGREVALRPEGTAGVVRHVAGLGEEGLASKVYYMGPMYRCERPQAGRKREFHQIGVEAFGEPNPLADAEVIGLQVQLLEGWGLKNSIVKINTRGALAEHQTVRDGLREALLPFKDELCEDCQRRLDQQVLRVLDCKAPGCIDVVSRIPSMHAFLSLESKQFLEEVLTALERLGVKAEYDSQLVRGLDYYEHTVWEITHAALGAQNALAGGGRYRVQMGKKQIPGVGFGIGVERVLSALEASGSWLFDAQETEGFWLVSLGDEALLANMELAMQLRKKGFRCGMELQVKSMKAQLRKADRFGANIALIRGDDELLGNRILVKNLTESQQEECDLASWLEALEGE